MNLRFQDNGASIRGEPERVMSAISKRRRTASWSSDLQGKFSTEADDEEELAASTQIQSTKKNKLIGLHQYFER